MYFRVLLKSGIAAVIIAAIAVVIACNGKDAVKGVDSHHTVPTSYTVLGSFNMAMLESITFVPLTNTYWVYYDGVEYYAESRIAKRIMLAKEAGLNTWQFQLVENEDGEGEVICVE